MADLQLNKPEAGQQVVLRDVADARLVLNFNPSDASLERQGDNLVFTFDDGSTVVLDNFYTAYSKDQLPDFEIEGAEVAGADFFAALDSTLMPAAGPAAGAGDAAARNARYSEYGNADLMGGIDRLGGLDLGFNGEPQLEDTLNGFGGRDDAGLLAANVAPGIVGNSGPIAADGALHVREAGVKGDAADIPGSDPNTLYEGVSTVTGTIIATDPDGDSLTFSLAPGAGVTVDGSAANTAQSITTAYGTLTIDNNGNYTYTLNNANANALNQDDTRTETFVVTVSDGRGGTVQQEISVTITGTNDRPDLSLTNTDMTAVDDGTGAGVNTITGTARGDDADSNAELRYSFGTDADGNPITEITDSYGTLTIDPVSGAYTYVLDSNSKDVQALTGQGDDVTRTVTVTVVDEHGANTSRDLTITVKGANDAPVIEVKPDASLNLKEDGVKDGGNITEPGMSMASGQVVASDVDNGDTLNYFLVDADGNYVTELTTPYGTVSINPLTGEYTYTLNNEAADALSQGDVRQESFTVGVKDSQGATSSTTQEVKVNIEGTNDKPELTLSKPALSVAAGSRAEGVDGSSFTVKDADADGAFGGSTDGAANQTYSIAGVNGTTGVGHDSGDVAGKAASFDTEHGVLTISPDGTYFYALDSDSDAVKSLAAGETRTETFEVTVTDIHGATSTQTINVTITGANDRPEITTPGGSLTLKESGVGKVADTGINDGWAEGEGQAKIDGAQHAESSFTVKDVDNNDSLTATITDANGNPVEGVVTDPSTGVMTLATEYGILTVTPTTNADGSVTYTYSYNLNDAAVNGLNQGESLEQHFNIAVKDGAGETVNQPVDVKIEGTNDAPTILFSNVHVKETGVRPGGNDATTDDGKDNSFVFPDHHRTEVEGQLTASDPDSGARLTFGINTGSNDGGVNTDGITVKLYTGEGASAKPVLDENGNQRTETLKIESSTTSTNADGHTIQTLVTEYGTLTLDTVTGHYTFAMNDGAANHLGAGEKFTFHFTTTVTDQYGAQGHHQLGITVEGTNDVPTLSLTNDHLGVQDDGTGTGTFVATGTAAGADVDLGAVLRYSFGTDEAGNPITTITDKYGTLKIDPVTGEYTYTLDKNSPDVQRLTGEGDDISQKYTVVVTDEHGAHSEQPLDITIKGANDAPVFGAGNSVKLTESGVVTGGNTALAGADFASNTITFSDPDAGSNLICTITNPGASAVDANGMQTLVTEYGTFTLNTRTGEYSFKLDNDADAVQRLGAGERANPRLNLTVTDEHGAKGSTWVQAEITGTNDRPELVLSGTPNLEVTEDGTYKVSQDANVRDVDKNDNHTYSISADDASLADSTPGNKIPTGTVAKGEHGTLTINPATGEYEYTLNNGSTTVQELHGAYTDANGTYHPAETLTETFTVYVKDKNGAWDAKQVTVTITGTDDAPVFNLDSLNQDRNLIEAGVKLNPDHTDGNTEVTGKGSMTGQLTATDADKGDTEQLQFHFSADKNGGDFPADSGNSSSQIVTEYGTVTLNPDGSYTYTLHNDPRVNALQQGEVREDTVYVTVVDPHGNQTTVPLVFTVHGTNDKPYFTATDANGNVIVNDGYAVEGNGQFAASITEGDASTVTGKVTAADYDLPAGGKLSYSLVGDNDHNVQTQPGQIEGKYGYLTLNQQTGEYTYTVYPDRIQHLGEGDKIVEDFTVRVTDNLNAHSEGKITITINGANDAPVLNTGSAAGSVMEDGARLDGFNNPSIAGKVTATDTDQNDQTNLKYSLTGEGVTAGADGVTVIEGKYGTLTLKPDGSYTYELTKNGSDDIQKLNNGDSIKENFGVSVGDGFGGTDTGSITITINGTNDAPTITSMGAGGLEVSRGNHSVTDRVTATDIDDPDGSLLYHFVDEDGNPVQTIKGEFGSITIDARTGEYTYTLNVNSDVVKNMTENGSDSFKVYVTDPHGATTESSTGIDITVTPGSGGGSGGLDYNVSVTGTPSLAVTEDMTVTASGELNFTVTDAAGNVVAGNPGFSLTPDHAQTELQNPYGALSIDPATGKYTFTLNNAHPNIQALGEGQNFDLTFKVYDINGNEAGEITVTVTGTNDAPKIESTENLTIKESIVTDADGSHSEFTGILEGQVHASDIDKGDTAHGLQGDTLRYYFVVNGEEVLTVTGAFGTITIDPATGKYTYELTDTGHRNADTTDHDTFQVHVSDGASETTGSIGVTIKGTNTAPTLDSATLADIQVTEDGNVTTSGSFTATDDAGGLTFVIGTSATHSGVSQGKYGTLILNPDGSYEYRLDNALKDVQGLKDGETLKDQFTITVIDKHGGFHTQTVDITVNGTDDAPQLFVDKVLSITETGSSVSGQADAFDLDKGDTLSFSLDGANEQGEVVTRYGTFSIDPATGKYTFTLNPDSPELAALKQNELHTETVKVQVTDANGNVTEQEVEVRITGTDTAPVLTADTLTNSMDATLTDATLTLKGTIAATDVDSDQAALSFHFDGGANRFEGQYGVIQMDPKSGEYKYVLNNDAKIHALGEGETTTETIRVTVTDEYGKSHTQDLEITITGTNDAPTITATGKNNGGSITVTDADVNDAHSLSIIVGGAAYEVNADGVCAIEGKGTFTLTQTGDGKWTYTFVADPTAQAGMREGDKSSFEFHIQVKDDSGADNNTATSGRLTVTIDGTNTAPQLGEAALILGLSDLVPDADFSITSSPDNSLALTDSDGDNLSYSFTGTPTDDGGVQGLFGTLHFNAEDGSYTYTLDTSAENLRALAEHHASGGDMTDSFGYTSTDGVWTGSNAPKGQVDVQLNPSATGDEHATHDQALFGGHDADNLHGGSGNDILSGGNGDDHLYGGSGDDLLFGGAGNDYLDGGVGNNQLYGGDGNDILVYNPGSSGSYDGGSGIDFMIGADRSTVDSLLSQGDTGAVSNVEVFVTQSPANVSLTSMNAMHDLGIMLHDNGTLSLSDAWQATAPSAGSTGLPDGFAEYTFHDVNGSGDDMTILVQKNILENHNG